LIGTLESEGHDIAVVDLNPAAVQACEEQHDVMVLVGYGASQQVLGNAGVKRADLVVAVTDQDEVNLVAAATAKALGAKKTVARVQSADWTSRDVGVEYGFLGIDVLVNPHVLLAQELALIARSHGAIDVLELAEHQVELVQVELKDSNRLAGRTLSKLRQSLPSETLVAAVVRRGELFVPGGGDVLMAGDRVYLLGRTGQMEQVQDLFTRVREARAVCIAGGTVVGEAFARALVRVGIETMMIVPTTARAEALAATLDKVTVVMGDGKNLEFLGEEQVGKYDLFAAMYADDQDNLLAGLLARKAGARRTAALVHRPKYADIYRQLGIDIVLSPRQICSESILRHCRTTSLDAVRVLEEGQAEVFEIVAPARARAVGIPLGRLKPPRGVLIGAILRADRSGGGREREVVVPGGEDVIQAGDTVIVLATREARPQVARLFQDRGA
jgi:trk system potassium uptake protein TrkA